MNKATILAASVGLLASSWGAFGAGKGDPAKGKEVFEASCAVCHNADSTEKKKGPGLKDLFKRKQLVNKKKVSEGNVLNKINEGGNGMPAFADQLSDDEKANVVAYLKTL